MLESKQHGQDFCSARGHRGPRVVRCHGKMRRATCELRLRNGVAVVADNDGHRRSVEMEEGMDEGAARRYGASRSPLKQLDSRHLRAAELEELGDSLPWLPDPPCVNARSIQNMKSSGKSVRVNRCRSIQPEERIDSEVLVRIEGDWWLAETGHDVGLLG